MSDQKQKVTRPSSALVDAELQREVERAYANEPTAKTGPVVEECLRRLGEGKLRVAQPTADGWQVNAWVKQAILLAFRLRSNRLIQGEGTRWYDKLGQKFAAYTEEEFARQKVRVVPGALAREGTYVAPNVVLMPSYINIGAYVDSGTMVDTWATVGSCAQIGKNVHLSGGVGIGGVLEPLQARPTIIEDDCFIGARSEIVEGVVVERGAVISMGVYLGQSTPIYDRARGEVMYGRVPAEAVVIPGSLPADDGAFARYAAIIMKRADLRTRAKVGLNALLRFEEE